MRRGGLASPGRALVALLACASLLLTACEEEEEELPSPQPTAQTSSPDSTDEPESPETPDTEPVTVFHFNIAGAKENKGQLDIIDKVVEHVEDEEPEVISLNEICAQQNQILSEQLRDLGYQGNYARNNRTPNCGINMSGGVAVYLADAKPYSGEDFNKQSGNQIGQSTACISGKGERAVYACSTHLHSGPNDAKKEAKRLRTVLPRKAGSRPLVIAGDFNLDPSHPAMQAMYATDQSYSGEAPRPESAPGKFHEVDMHGSWCAGTRPPHRQGECTSPNKNPDRKIDYIFVDSESFAPEVTAEVRDAGECDFVLSGRDDNDTRRQDCSDHRQLWGSVHLVEEPDLIWGLKPRFRGDCHENPIGCIKPTWEGSATVDEDDGTIDGDGDVFFWDRANNKAPCHFVEPGMVDLDAQQRVDLEGDEHVRSVRNGDTRTLRLSLTFEAPKVDNDVSRCPDRRQAHLQYTDPLRKHLAIDEPLRVEVPVGPAENDYDTVPVSINEFEYEFYVYDSDESGY